MSDYNLFPGCFTIKEQDIIKTLKNARAAGYPPMIIINGLYYDIKFADPAPDVKPENSDNNLPF